jgi:2-iminobutanoate/2-iminopropanoate deaminase
MAATFVMPPGRDLGMMDKLGLGGIALVENLVFTGGMAIDLRTLKRPDDAETIADETRLCFDGIEQNLAEVGCTLRDIVKITCYVEDADDRAEMEQMVTEVFAPGPCPKRITIVAGIGGNCRVEFEVLAVRPGQPLSADRLVFATATALDPTTMRRVPEADTIANETRICLERLDDTLGEAGLTLRDIAKFQCWVNDEPDRMDFIYAYRDLMAPAPYPSRATFSIGIPGDARVQLDAIAVRPTREEA